MKWSDFTQWETLLPLAFLYHTTALMMEKYMSTTCTQTACKLKIIGKLLMTWQINFRTRRRENLSGKFKLTTGENRGVFNVKYDLLPSFLNFEVLPDFIQSYNTTVTILHTDYDNFAILWSCTNIRQYGHVENAWLLTRDQVPTEEVLQSSYGFLDKFGLRNFFIKSNQENCDP